MELAKASKLFLVNAAWRTTGARAAGRSLIEGLGSPDENVRMIAGTFLSRAGKQALPLIREAVRKGQHTAQTLTILGDLGNLTDEPIIRRYVADADPEVAKSARYALELLHTRMQSASTPEAD
ncbi:MAG: hypothetical protein HY231_16990 [Acidobacteria bacterium]|nr:hypothetical protein [Acidobacteriota bacterium]